MAVLLKNGPVFLHVPKTGGAWVVHVLRALNLVDHELDDGHADYERTVWNGNFARDSRVLRNVLKRHFGDNGARRPARDAPLFCFVREPLKWLESTWRHKQRRNWEDWGVEGDPLGWHCACWLNGLGSPDFNAFVTNINRKRPGFVTELFGRFARPEVGFVGRQESLTEDLIKALHFVGARFDEAAVRNHPRVNASPANVPIPEWDPAVRRETLRLEYAGYRRYGYALPADFSESVTRY
jgi:hypothetical protein